MSMFFLLISGIGYFVSYFTKDENTFIFTLFFATVWIFVSYFFSDKVALKISGARVADRKNSKELMLIRLLENLSISQGIKVPKIFVIDDVAMNAFATGRGEKNASIVFTTGILEVLEKKEIEGVAAHELSHIKNKDIMIATISVALIGVIAILSDMVIRMVFYSDEKKHPAVYIVAIVLGIASPIVAKLIQLSISRKREFLADSSAVLMTRFPEGLASALEKISTQNVVLKKQSNAIAHLYISNPFGKTKNFLSEIFSTHPPIEDRIKALKNM
jgi:heat shock protein HtpX